MRNPLVKKLCWWFGGVGAAAGLAAGCFHPLAGLLCLLACGLLLAVVLRGIKEHYAEIARLSRVIERVSVGDYGLDIRDNQEGELSILKNDIYKVVLRLREQTELLRKDKLLLADAISDISHQLKTPLTSMGVMADLLSDEHLEEAKRAEFTRNIRQQLERMEWLLTSLLKLSKIDAGTVTFQREPILLADVLERAAAPLLIPMDIREQSLHVDGKAREITIEGDMNWTAEALVNLLKNCVEHTPERGSISVTCAQNHIYTQLVITDTGEGIDPQDLPHVFERFYKGKNSAEDSVGIGLAMAKSILSRQNATVSVKSSVGAGTSFEVKWYRQIV